MIQTLAIFKDAYRELNAKKLFWFVLVISGIVVAAFGCVGVNEKGISVLWWSFPSSIFNSMLFPGAMFYKIMLANLGVKIWLAWIAAILALVSTASMIPEFISGGSIELALSKPIGRLRLFLTKYLAGLLFVTLQVAVFSVGAFLVIGLRGKEWEPGIFWAVPLTVAFFSYLFSACVLLGMVTRSTIASLLLTLLLWFCIWAVHTTEATLLTFRTKSEMQVEKAHDLIAKLETQKKEFEAKQGENAKKDAPPADGEAAPAQPPTWSGANDLQKYQLELPRLEKTERQLKQWHTGFYLGMTVLPKTAETVDLLERKLISDADLKELREKNDNGRDMSFPGDVISVPQKKVAERVEDKMRSRSVGWILGTSIAFEALMLSVAAFIFCRRDF